MTQNTPVRVPKLRSRRIPACKLSLRCGEDFHCLWSILAEHVLLGRMLTQQCRRLSTHICMTWLLGSEPLMTTASCQNI